MQNSIQSSQPHATAPVYSLHNQAKVSPVLVRKRTVIILTGAFLFILAVWLADGRASGILSNSDQPSKTTAASAAVNKGSPPNDSATDPEPPPRPSGTNTNTTRVEVNGQKVTVPANGSTSYTSSNGSSTTTVNVQHSSTSSGSGNSNSSNVHVNVDSSSSGE